MLMIYRLLEFDRLKDRSTSQPATHKLCVTLLANVNINYCRICTIRHFSIEIIHGSYTVFRVLTWVDSIVSMASMNFFLNMRSVNICFLSYYFHVLRVDADPKIVEYE